VPLAGSRFWLARRKGIYCLPQKIAFPQLLCIRILFLLNVAGYSLQGEFLAKKDLGEMEKCDILEPLYIRPPNISASSD